MPVPSTINDLSTTAGSNYPSGSETPTEGDNYLRTLSSFIALLRDKLNGTSATGTIKDATHSGNPAGTILGSTYSPTPVAVANFSAAAANTHQYMRIGPIVHVAGSISGIATAGPVQVRVPIPIGSNFTNTYDMSGAGTSAQDSRPAFVNADTTNDAAVIQWTSTGGAASVWYEFMYEVK